MRAHHLLLAGLIASAVATSAFAQGKSKAGAGSAQGIDFNGATGGDRGAAAGFDSGVKGNYSLQGGGLSPGASALPPLSPPPPGSAIGSGPPGPPGRPTAPQ